MSIKYDSRRVALSEVIKMATSNATYVLPDLQRPYVWSPRQVTLLIDSLFRGWPFGSLLLWEVKPDCYGENEGIPHRPFWHVVDRTDRGAEPPASTMGQPATYHMVLDGQQRIQSLILALGEDQWGFTLYDHEWALDLQERRVKPSEHWSAASLFVDLDAFRSEVSAKGGKVRKVETGKILQWVTPEFAARPQNYGFPILARKEHPGRFVRLSRFWDLVEKDLSESEYADLLRPMLDEHAVRGVGELVSALAQFMKVVENVKNNSFVHALQIESFQVSAQWNKDDYNDAIVNIFTRLNTAGRTLTREEITLAWLKVGWEPKLTDERTAGKCLEALRLSLENKGFRVEMDEIVRLLSFVWAVDYNDGVLLDSKDLLKGDIIRPMAGAIAIVWNSLEARLNDAADEIQRRELVESQGSFNAVIVYLTWHRMVFEWADGQVQLQVVPRDTLKKRLQDLSSSFLDRWVFSSQWANAWGENATQNFQNFAKDLRQLRLAFGKARGAEIPAPVGDSVEALLGRVAPKAIEAVNALVVRSRHQVHKYHDALWVWHRLGRDRWDASSTQMLTGRKRKGKLEVDHTIADAWWKRLIDTVMEEKIAAFTGSDEDRAAIAPDGFESKAAAVEFVNQLGNCSLLYKSFNISKSDHAMWTFLQEVREFKDGVRTREAWEKALLLSPAMTDPDGSVFATLVASIRDRDAAIKRDLVAFLSGSIPRSDVE